MYVQHWTERDMVLDDHHGLRRNAILEMGLTATKGEHQRPGTIRLENRRNRSFPAEGQSNALDLPNDNEMSRR
jgi:hypothetical protein